MNIHILEKEKHYDFLHQERIDPITGDILQEGDQIVICASCKSAFLADSWLYMDAKHCNQTHTLIEIPIQGIVKIDRESRNERLDKLAFYQFRTVKESEAVNVYTGFFGFLGGIIGYTTYLTNNLEFIFLGALIFLFGYITGKRRYKQKYLLLDSGYFIINQNKKDEVIIDSKSIESIEIEKAKFFSRIANSFLFKKHEKYYNLIIKTNEGESHKVFISENELKRIEQETNILKKFPSKNYSQIPFQNSPLIAPNTRNNRFDLGSHQ